MVGLYRAGRTVVYASEGLPSIPPEQLLSALLLQMFYGIRSERQLMEQLDYNLLYRWSWDVANFVNTSPFCSRSRFLVKVVGSPNAGLRRPC